MAPKGGKSERGRGWTLQTIILLCQEPLTGWSPSVRKTGKLVLLAGEMLRLIGIILCDTHAWALCKQAAGLLLQHWVQRASVVDNDLEIFDRKCVYCISEVGGRCVSAKYWIFIYIIYRGLLILYFHIVYWMINENYNNSVGCFIFESMLHLRV